MLWAQDDPLPLLQLQLQHLPQQPQLLRQLLHQALLVSALLENSIYIM